MRATKNPERWETEWGSVRDQLPEFPEDWFKATRHGTDPSPEWVAPDGAPGPASLDQERLVRALGAAIDDEIIRRLEHNHLVFPARPVEVERLRNELFHSDEAIGPDAFDDLVDETAVALFGNQGPELIRVDDDARFQACAVAYEPDMTRGKIAANFEPFLRNRKALSQVLLSHETRFWAAQRTWVTAYREEARVLLRSCRQLGAGTARSRAILTHLDYEPPHELEDAMDRASEWVPRYWIEEINNYGAWTLTYAERAWFSPSNRAVGVAGAPNRITASGIVGGAAHALGLMAAHVLPHLARASWVFLDRRVSVDGALLPLRPLDEVSFVFHEDETWRDGGFIHPLVGRCGQVPAPTDRYMIIPIGLQSLITGWPDMTVDPDHRQFLLGILSAG